MCDQGLLIRTGPRKYALFQEYFPEIELNRLSEEEAIIGLVQQYLESFGPATIKDISWWMGHNKTTIQNTLNNIRNQIIHIKIPDLKNDYVMLRKEESIIKKLWTCF